MGVTPIVDTLIISVVRYGVKHETNEFQKQQGGEKGLPTSPSHAMILCFGRRNLLESINGSITFETDLEFKCIQVFACITYEIPTAKFHGLIAYDFPNMRGFGFSYICIYLFVVCLCVSFDMFCGGDLF